MMTTQSTSELVFTPRNAAANLRRYELHNRRITLAELALSLAGAVFSIAIVSWFLIWIVVAVLPFTASSYAVIALRARSVRRGLGLYCRRVLVVGWVRGPECSSYAVFPVGSDPIARNPEYVMRLTTAEPVGMAEALFTGSRLPRRSAAILGQDGELLGLGSIRTHAKGLRVWSRRHKKTPFWLRGPEIPTDKLPPV
jgi:hypothetical protein